jgi:hypothetical protein
MKKLFLMFALAGSMVASAQSQQMATCLASDSVVVQPSEVRCDSTQCLPTDTMCCDTTQCAEGSSAADGKADYDHIWWYVAGAFIAGFLLVTAIMNRNNNRMKQ